MKTLMLGAFILPVCNAAFAQYPEFAPVGATWYYSETQMNGDLQVVNIQSIGTDTVHGKSCKILKEETSGVPFYAYRDSLKIYISFFTDTEWHILYDFSLSVNDTLFTHTTLGFNIPVKVISKGDTSINGYSLPYMYLESIDQNWNYTSKSILNVGSETYFYATSPTQDPAPDGLRCYQDHLFGQYVLSLPCDTNIIIGIHENIEIEEVFLSPNPTDDYVLVPCDIGTNSIFIANSSGEVVLKITRSLNQRQKERINIESLPSGCFIITVQSAISQSFYQLIKEP